MKKLLKPACIVFYLLTLFTFFLIGLFFAKFIGAGKSQGLAGGAVVMGWGTIFGGSALVLSIIIAYYVQLKTLVKLNFVLFAILLALMGYIFFMIKEGGELMDKNNGQNNLSPTAIIKPAMFESTSYTKDISTGYHFVSTNQDEESEMGMGFFIPNMYENSKLNFYGEINLEKSLNEHPPFDSIVFKKNKYNHFEISSAPPWLFPEVLKLDYDLLYFRIKSVTEDFAEVIVNKQTNQSSFVSRMSGKIIYWPDFFLSVNSVEFYPDTNEKIHVRPFLASSTTNLNHQFMRPVKISGDWMEVLLLNSNFVKVGKGWIQWKRENKILVIYNLLS